MTSVIDTPTRRLADALITPNDDDFAAAGGGGTPWTPGTFGECVDVLRADSRIGTPGVRSSALASSSVTPLPPPPPPAADAPVPTTESGGASATGMLELTPGSLDYANESLLKMLAEISQTDLDFFAPESTPGGGQQQQQNVLEGLRLPTPVMPMDTATKREAMFSLSSVPRHQWSEAQRRRGRMAELVEEYRRLRTVDRARAANVLDEFLREANAAARSDHDGGSCARRFVDGREDIDPAKVKVRIKSDMWTELRRAHGSRRVALGELQPELRRRFRPNTTCVVCRRRRVDGVFTNRTDCRVLQRFPVDPVLPPAQNPCSCPVFRVCFDCVYDAHAAVLAAQTCSPDEIGTASVFASCHSQCLACGGKMCPMTAVRVDYAGAIFDDPPVAEEEKPASFKKPKPRPRKKRTKRSNEQQQQQSRKHTRESNPRASEDQVTFAKPVPYFLNNHSKVFGKFPVSRRAGTMYSFIQRRPKKGSKSRARPLPAKMRKDRTLDMRARGERVVQTLNTNAQRLARGDDGRASTVTTTQESSSYVVHGGVSTETLQRTTTVTHVAPMPGNKRQRIY